MADSATLVRQLSELVGTAHVVEDTAAFTLGGRAALLAVAPGSVEELAQCVAACYAARMPMVAWGGGTMQSWGNPPAAAQFVVIHTRRLDRVLIYEPDDLTISVQAGMPLAALETQLAAHGQMLPLDAPQPERTTIGGILATASDGPRRLGYGTARDLLIGIKVVEATGRISKAGGMVVKNVSGFDMMKLYLGSLGTLAIIVSANFKLLPRPRAVGTIACRFWQPAQALALAEQLATSQLTPVAVEYHEGWTNDYHGVPMVSLDVRIESLPAAVERHLHEIAVMAEAAGATEIEALSNGSPELQRQWMEFSNHPQTVELPPNELVLRLACLPGELADALAKARELAEQNELRLKLSAHALSGVAYLRACGMNAALRHWHSALLTNYPHLNVLATPPELVGELPMWGQPPANLALMQRLKAEFDPENLLNPGRFVV